MYDEETGFYYDVQTNEDGSEKKLLVNRGKGTEGWIPLWAKAATKDKAARVVESMTAVSYTHLDVYKRQGILLLPVMIKTLLSSI